MGVGDGVVDVVVGGDVDGGGVAGCLRGDGRVLGQTFC